MENIKINEMSIPSWKIESVDALIDRCKQIPAKLGIQEFFVYSLNRADLLRVVSRGKLTARQFATIFFQEFEPQLVGFSLLECKPGDRVHCYGLSHTYKDMPIINLTGLDEDGIQQVRVNVASAKYVQHED